MGRSPLSHLLVELKRRRVYRVAAVYVVVGWVLLQLGNIVVEPLHLPEWTMTLLIVLLVVGLPVALVLAWAFDITPQGVRRTAPPGGKEMAGVPPGGEAAVGVSPGAPEAGGGGRAGGGQAGEGRGPEEPAPPAPERVRNAAFVGLGILVAVLAMGTYAFFQGEIGGRGVAEADEVDAFHALVVVPFTSMSPDPENEYFADGVTEDILTHLALVPDFAVPSRTTAMRYKGTTLSVPEIAAELGVRYVLEGSVRRAGERVRITAQLVDGRSDQPLWAEMYDRHLEDIFAVQNDIATSIVAALEGELARGVAARIERPPTEDLEAYDLFLRGRDNLHRYTEAGTERAIEAFRAALERDPGFSLARAWLARAYVNYHYNHRAPAHWADSALVQARRAVDEDPELAAAHTALGTALSSVGRYAEAQETLERATSLNPNDWAAVANLGLIHANQGRFDEAVRLTRRSLEREAGSAYVAHSNLASYYGRLGMMDRAEESVARSLELAPDHGTGLFLSGILAFARGDREEAAATATRLTDGTRGPVGAGAAISAATVHGLLRDPEPVARLVEPIYRDSPETTNGIHTVGVLYGWALLASGRGEEGAQALSRTEAHLQDQISSGSERAIVRQGLAAIQALRGDREGTLRWLEEAFDLGWASVELVAWEPAFDDLRDDPRFRRIVDRMAARQAEMRRRVIREGW